MSGQLTSIDLQATAQIIKRDLNLIISIWNAEHPVWPELTDYLTRLAAAIEPVNLISATKLEPKLPLSHFRKLRKILFSHLGRSGILHSSAAQIIHEYLDLSVERAALGENNYPDYLIELKNLQSRLAQAVSISKTGFYDWDMVNDIVVYSDQMKQDWGLVQNTPISGALEIIHPADRPRAAALIEKSIREKIPFVAEYRLIRPTDGKTVWIQAHGELDHDLQGKPIRFFGTSVDISKQKKSEQRLSSSERQLKLVTDSLPVLISYLDENRIYRFLNPPYEEWFKTPRAELIGKSIETVSGGAYHVLKPYLDRAYAGEIVEYDQTAPFDLGVRDIHVVYTPDRDPESGKIRGLVTLVYDVTKQKTTEKALQEAVNSRDEFLSIASHELKTPLTSMRLQTQLMKRAISRSADGTVKADSVARFVEQSERSAERLNRLVDDMLDMTRISSTVLSLSLEHFDLWDLIKEVFERMCSHAEMQGVLLSVGRCERVEGNWDRFRLDQVITNLISNALKYGEKSPIELSLFKKDDTAFIEVKDCGPGIAEEFQEKVFNRFERVHSSSKISGLGLGLHICKEIVERHRGHIKVESMLGKGATFIVELPCALPLEK